MVGLGVMGRHHARVLAGLPEVEFVSIVDPVHAGQIVQGVEVHSEIDALLDAGVDYSIISTPTADHLTVGAQLAARGVHALIEKPLAPTSAEAAQLLSHFESAGLTAAVGHIERFNAALREARSRIAAGQIGRVLQVTTSRQGPFPGRISDVGVVKDLATHDIDITAWITGQRYASVAANVAYRSGRPHEDMLTATAVLGDGTIVAHTVNWLSPRKERRVTVVGEKGALVADTLGADLTFYENGTVPTTWDEVASFRGVSEGDVVRYAFPKPEPLQVEHRAFLEALSGNPSDIVTLADGHDVVRVAECLLESASSGRSVSMDWNQS